MMEFFVKIHCGSLTSVNSSFESCTFAAFISIKDTTPPSVFNRLFKKLDLLIIKAFIGPFIATFFITLFVLVLQFFWLYIDDIVGKGVDMITVARLILYVSATLVPLALPLAVLLSSIMTFGNLGETFELIAIKSAGIPLLRFMRPLLIISVIICYIAFLFNNNIIPIANLKMNTLKYDIIVSKPAFDIKEGVFYDKIEGYVIKIGKKEKDDSTIRNVVIYQQNYTGQQDDIIIAENGKMVVSPDKHSLIFVLQNGWIYQEGKGDRMSTTNDFIRMGFKEYKKILDLSSFKLNKTEDSAFKNNYQMLTLRQLGTNIDSLEKKNKAYREAAATNMHNGLKFSQMLDTTGWAEVEKLPTGKVTSSYLLAKPSAPITPATTPAATPAPPTQSPPATTTSTQPTQSSPAATTYTQPTTQRPATAAATTRPDTANKGIVRNDTTHRDATNKGIVRNDTTHKNATNKGIVQNDTAHKGAANKAIVRNDTTHKGTTNKGIVQNDTTHKGATNKAIVRNDTTHRDTAKKDIAKIEAVKKDSTQKNISKKDSAKEKNAKTQLAKADKPAPPPPPTFRDYLPDSTRSTVTEHAISQLNAVKIQLDQPAYLYSNLDNDLRVHLIAWHEKLTLSVACLVMFLIGAPLGSIIRKGGIGLPLVFAVIFFVIFFLLNNFGKKFVKEDVLTPIAGMWMATYVLTPIGLFLVYKALHDSQLFNKEFYFRIAKAIRKMLRRRHRGTGEVAQS